VRYRALWIPVLLAGCLTWSYWPTITELFEFWGSNDDYSVGQLVPLVALYLVWRARAHLAKENLRPSRLGLAVVLLSQVVRFAGVYYAYGSAERYSLVLLVSGLILLLAGQDVWRRLIWVQAFLLLMVPLPGRIHNLISLPLQDGATLLGVFALESLGFYVAREGNILHLGGETTVMVAEACSGLRMLTAFVFTAAVLTFLIRRPVWQKVTLVVSSIPIAVVSNGLRVLIMSIAIHYVQDTTVEQRFHDLAGLLMMPLAIVILLVELKLLQKLASAAAPGRPVAAQTRAG
jgi:exosortase